MLTIGKRCKHQMLQQCYRIVSSLLQTVRREETPSLENVISIFMVVEFYTIIVCKLTTNGHPFFSTADWFCVSGYFRIGSS